MTRIRRIAPPYVAQFAFVVLSISIKLVGVSTLPAHGSGPKGADASKFNPLADHVWAWSRLWPTQRARFRSQEPLVTILAALG